MPQEATAVTPPLQVSGDCPDAYDKRPTFCQGAATVGVAAESVSLEQRQPRHTINSATLGLRLRSTNSFLGRYHQIVFVIKQLNIY